MSYISEVHKSKKIILEGGIILYPTDTIWGIGCDATNEISVARIYRIKQREYTKSLIVLVSDLTMLEKYVEEVPARAKELMREIKRPLTIIYSGARAIAKNAIPKEKTIAIRIPKDEFCISLIKEINRPIISTSANISGKNTPGNFLSIDEEIKTQVDYIVDYKRNISDKKKSSTIVKIENNNVIFLRK